MNHLILLSDSILIVGLSFLLYRWPKGAEYSFSQHAAISRGASIYYAVIFLIALPGLILYFAFWFLPTFHASWLLLAVVITASVFQVACTFIPERGARMSILAHQILAGISGGLLIPAAILVTMSPIDNVSRIVVLLGIIVMIGATAYAGLQKAKTVPYTLQLVYYTGFLLPLTLIAYGV